MNPLDFMTPLVLFQALVFAHCLADYPLQGDFMARAKNHRAPIAGVPPVIILMTHSIIHAGFVAMLTGNLVIGLLEFLAHTLIDYVKCDGRITYGVDQGLHVLCKIAWVALSIAWRI